MDFLWSKPDLTQDKIFVVSDGSEKDGIGGMATLIADLVLQKVFVYTCQVTHVPARGKINTPMVPAGKKHHSRKLLQSFLSFIEKNC
mmetsp:Transcript_10919/g.15098  ORF Transcript_10919/g.15098 Transcript_10919/m.15098 type:complete len:87 (-) Transcript_10919:1246-1506(-)